MLGRLRKAVSPLTAGIGGERGTAASVAGSAPSLDSSLDAAAYTVSVKAFGLDCRAAASYYAQGGNDRAAQQATSAFCRVVDALLAESEASESASFVIGKRLECFLERKVMEAVCLGVMSAAALGLGGGRCTPMAVASALSACARLVARSEGEALLPHAAVHRPLGMLLERAGALGADVAAAAEQGAAADCSPGEALVSLANAVASKLFESKHLHAAFGGTQRSYSMLLDVLAPFLPQAGHAGDRARTGLLRCLHAATLGESGAPRVVAALAKGLEAAVVAAAARAEGAPNGVRCNHLDMSELEDRWEYCIMVTEIAAGGTGAALSKTDAESAESGEAVSPVLATALIEALVGRLATLCNSLSAGVRDAKWRRGTAEALRRLVVAACARGTRRLGAALVARIASDARAADALASCLHTAEDEAVSLTAARLIEALASGAAALCVPSAERALVALPVLEGSKGASTVSSTALCNASRSADSPVDWWDDGDANHGSTTAQSSIVDQLEMPADGAFASLLFGFAPEGNAPESSCAAVPMEPGQAAEREAYTAYVTGARDALRRRMVAARARDATSVPEQETSAHASSSGGASLLGAVAGRLAAALSNEPTLNGALTAFLATLATSRDRAVHEALLARDGLVQRAFEQAMRDAKEAAERTDGDEWAAKMARVEGMLATSSSVIARDQELRLAAGAAVVKHAALELQATAEAKCVLMALGA